MPKRSENKAEFTTEGNTLQNLSNSNSFVNSQNSDNVIFDTNICLYNKGLSTELAKSSNKSLVRSPIKLNEQGQI